MTPATKPEQPKQPIKFPWGVSIAATAIIVFLILFQRNCKGDPEPSIVYAKADSALQDELRRARDSAAFYKQYQWKTDILQTQLSETERAIVTLTGTIQKMEARIKKPIVITDSADCAELATQVNQYIDTAIAYRELRDVEKAQYEAWLSSERGFSSNLRRLLDSCRGAVNVIAPAIVKPRGQVYLGLMGATNLGFVFGGPEIMYKDNRDRIYRIGTGWGNSKPWYSAGLAVKLKFGR